MTWAVLTVIDLEQNKEGKLAYNVGLNMDKVWKFHAWQTNGKLDTTMLFHTNGERTLVKHTWEEIADLVLGAVRVNNTVLPKKEVKPVLKEQDKEANAVAEDALEPPTQFVRRKNVMTSSAIQQG